MSFSFTSDAHCLLCPRKCGADRTKGVGTCGCDSQITVAKAMIHRWEEPCISGNDPQRGAGAVFFSGCPLGCVYCQNMNISRGGVGRVYSVEALAELFDDLADRDAYNIDLVSPTQYLPGIAAALRMRKSKLPAVFNTGGYERPESIEALRGTADIFLTDFKYGSADIAAKYSRAPDYVQTARSALRVMTEMCGPPEYDKDGIMQKGVIVRHLVLPGCRHDSVRVLERIAETVDPENVVLSLMSQYTPGFASPSFKELDRRVTTFEYEYVRKAALDMGFSGYGQDVSSAKKSYTPDFLT